MDSCFFKVYGLFEFKFLILIFILDTLFLFIDAPPTEPFDTDPDLNLLPVCALSTDDL